MIEIKLDVKDEQTVKELTINDADGGDILVTILVLEEILQEIKMVAKENFLSKDDENATK